MSSNEPNTPDRNERIRAVVEETLSRRASGVSVSDAEILARHQDLLPELAQELAVLAILERARAGSASRGGAATSSNAPTQAPPAGYSFIREIHRGGQGVVFEAIQNATGRRVAVKLRRAGVLADYREIERFEREVEILAQLEHPSIVRIIDTGMREADPFFVMDFVDGVPLDDYIASRSLGVPEVVLLFAAIVRAVSAAHLRGVIHRDLKPANILVDQAGVPHLLDFGLARLAEQVDRSGATLTGQFIGSVPWASPEQAEGIQAGIDLRADVYSLGVILFHMLTGAMPYECRGTLPEVISIIRNARPIRPSALRKQIDADLDTIILKCLAKEPERRYQSANELLEDLVRWTEHRPIAARPPSVVYQLRLFARRNRTAFAAAVCVVVAVLVGFAATYRQLRLTQAAEREAIRQKLDADSSRKRAEWQSYRAAMSAVEAAFDLGDARLLTDRLEVAPAELRSWEWYHAQQRTAEQFEILKAPTGSGSACEIVIAAEQRLVQGYVSGTVRLMDLKSKLVLWSTEVQSPVERCVVSNGAGRLLVGCSNAIAVLDLASGKILHKYSADDGSVATDPVHGSIAGGGGIFVLAMPPDGSVAVTSTDSTTLQLQNLETGAIVRTLKFKSAVSFAEFSPDGSILAVAENGAVSLWDTDNYHEMTRWETVRRDNSMAPHALRFSPNGRSLVGTFGTAVAVFDVPTGTQRYIFRMRHVLEDVAFSPDMRRIAAIDNLGTITVWELNRQLFARSILGGPTRGRRIGFVDDNTVVLSSFQDPDIRMVSITEAQAYQTIDSKGFAKIGFDALSHQMRVGFGRNLVGRDLVARTEVRSQLPAGITRARAFDRGGELAACVDDQGRLCVVNLTTQKTLWTTAEPTKGLALAAFGEGLSDRMIWVDATGKVQVCTISSGARVREVESSGVGSVAITPDGKIGAWAETAGKVHLLDLSTGVEQSFECGLAVTWGLALSRDGKSGAVCGQGGTVIFSATDIGQAKRIPSGDAVVVGVAFSPDGTRLASGGDSNTVTVFDTRAAEPVLTLPNCGAAINSLTWSDDGESLAAASGAENSTVFVWHGHFPKQTQQPAEKAWTKSR